MGQAFGDKRGHRLVEEGAGRGELLPDGHHRHHDLDAAVRRPRGRALEVAF